MSSETSKPVYRPTLAIPVADTERFRGKKDAPITLLEYGDYECSYCGKASPVVKAVREHFGDKLKMVYRHFPHSNIHPHASMAAQAAEAAGAQGKFWEMHDLLFENQNGLDMTDLGHYALKIGLELYHFNSDLSTERYAKRVAEDYRGGVAGGVKKTPTIFINGQFYDGPMETPAMIGFIERLA